MSNSKEFLLIIEDEQAISQGLEYNFLIEGFNVKIIEDGATALEFIKLNHEKISAIILDLMLPMIDGYSLLIETRHFAERVPILILSAKSLESDKAKAFELGADDFVTKPFVLSELILRVKRLIKRFSWNTSVIELSKEPVKFGLSLFNTNKLSVTDQAGVIHRLSPTEGLLIQTFLDNRNKILSRGELLQKVWQYEAMVETRTVDVFIGKLRKYCEKNPAKPVYLKSVRGAGYIYEVS